MLDNLISNMVKTWQDRYTALLFQTISGKIGEQIPSGATKITFCARHLEEILQHFPGSMRGKNYHVQTDPGKISDGLAHHEPIIGTSWATISNEMLIEFSESLNQYLFLQGFNVKYLQNIDLNCRNYLITAELIITYLNTNQPKPGLVAFKLRELDSSIFYAPSDGTFYESSRPGESCFVSAGDVVEAGAPVCIIELSKTMQYISAHAKLRINSIIAQNGVQIKEGDPLFRVTIVDEP